MPLCPACDSEVEARASACPRCHTPLSLSDELTRLAGTNQPDADATRLAPTSTHRSRSRGSQSPTSSSGWLSSSGAIDHGRFPPGTLLGGRYRIVGRLGRGGMGEVYRADDLKLGQPVALKFLSPEVDGDPTRLTQLHTEVRMARQVSHPNVCRVYDIDEIDGQTFLSMEYVDGEDLASLLRRIGRFPEDRALEIARQICAGLAAAHERGVIHRDFKPANVMLDGSGKVRITDFGLAGVAGESLRAGTPAYMAPEQLAGAEVTARSDIYALGLVLYEVFTGRRALEGKNLAELIHKREQSGIVPPSAIVRDLSPQIEQAILRCLQVDPAERPSSALGVAAALPGGDPLAAALAAGETPSPEMVAAAGSNEAISTRWAVAGGAWVVLSLLALLVMYQRVLLINRVPLPKAPAALEDRAQEALARLGYKEPSRDSASGMTTSLDYANYIGATSSDRNRWNKLSTDRPESVVLWYRTSPRPLIPLGMENNLTGLNPPLNVSGMTLTVVDASGRLGEFLAVPDPTELAAPKTPTDWSPLFAAAGLPMMQFASVEPKWIPPVYADERMAWEGRLPEQSDLTFHVEAGASHGRPVFFVVTGPWSRSSRSAPVQPSAFNRMLSGVAGLVMPGLMVLGALLARHNLRLGRGDRRGAFRAASILFATTLGAWLLGATHASDVDVEIGRIFAAIGRALFNAAVLWLTYLGLEPYVRRFSPNSLIGWTRMIAGQWKDPYVGSDVLVGVSAGLAMTLFFPLYTLLPPVTGHLEPMPVVTDPRALTALRFLLSAIAAQIVNAISSGMLGMGGIVASLIFFKRRWLAFLVTVVVYTPVVVNGMFSPGYPALALILGACIISVLIAVAMRYGLLACITALATHFILLRAPLTIDASTWRGPASLWYLGLIGAAGLGACLLARGAIASQRVNLRRVHEA